MLKDTLTDEESRCIYTVLITALTKEQIEFILRGDRIEVMSGCNTALRSLNETREFQNYFAKKTPLANLGRGHLTDKQQQN